MNLIARDERQQRPVATCEEKKRDAPRECAAQRRIVSRVAKAESQRAAETFNRQRACRFLRLPPPDDRGVDAEIAHRINDERRGNSERPDHGTCKRRSDRATDVDANAIPRNCGRERAFWYQFRRDRLPSRRGQGAEHADEKHERQERHRRNVIGPDHCREDRRNDRVCRFANDQQLAPIHDVGKSTRGEREQEKRQCVGDLHQRDEQRSVRKVGHQPAGGCRVHPTADIRDNRRGPDDCECFVLKRRPG